MEVEVGRTIITISYQVYVYFPPSDSPQHYGLLGSSEEVSLVQGGEEAACEEDGDKERVQRPPPPVSSGDNKEKVEHQQLMAIITRSIKS